MNTCKANSLLARSASAVIVFCLLAGLATVAIAQNTTVHGNTPGFVQKAKDLGPTDPNTVITVTAWLKLHNEAQLDKLVKQQNQKGSPSYHKWISQAQFDASFGPTAQELKAVQNFLNAHGLTTIDIAQNNAYVKVQGTVDAVQKAFHVQIDNFSFEGQTYRSNKNDPSVGGLLAGTSRPLQEWMTWALRPMSSRPPAPTAHLIHSPLSPNPRLADCSSKGSASEESRRTHLSEAATPQRTPAIATAQTSPAVWDIFLRAATRRRKYTLPTI